jgi:hypothetical protein
MERSPRRISNEKSVVNEANEIFDFIFRNGMGMPIIFDAAPTKAQMNANTWGKVTGVNTALYVKFADGGAIKITGTELA